MLICAIDLKATCGEHPQFGVSDVELLFFGHLGCGWGSIDVKHITFIKDDDRITSVVEILFYTG